MTAFARLTPDGVLQFQGQRWRASFGRGGIRADKQEGDGATPSGSLPLRRVMYRADRVKRPVTPVPTEPLAPSDGWCDDPTFADYNRAVTLPHEARHEALWRDDALYDVIGVLGWNDRPVLPYRGSAIFLHAARMDLAPTDGCVALLLEELLALLASGCEGVTVEG